MTTAIYAQLAVLALIDSTSIGTLLIPLWLLLRPDTRRMLPRIFLYLGVLAGFYLLVGIAVLCGAGWAVDTLGAGSPAQIPAVQWIMVLAGGGMLAYAVLAKPAGKGAKVPAATAGAAGSRGTAPTGALGEPAGATELKWQARLSRALRSPGGIVGLALLAGLLELPTMVPYLVAIGLLSNSTLPLSGGIAVLAVYCLAMLVPALLLLALRTALGHRLEPLLRRISATMGKVHRRNPAVGPGDRRLPAAAGRARGTGAVCRVEPLQVAGRAGSRQARPPAQLRSAPSWIDRRKNRAPFAAGGSRSAGRRAFERMDA